MASSETMGLQAAIRHMISTAGTSYAQVSRDLGRNDRYIAVMLNEGTIPRTDLLAKIAEACGYDLILEGHGERLKLTSGATRVEMGQRLVEEGQRLLARYYTREYKKTHDCEPDGPITEEMLEREYPSAYRAYMREMTGIIKLQVRLLREATENAVTQLHIDEVADEAQLFAAINKADTTSTTDD